MLPDLIEIVPLSEPVQAQITVPGSKSITNRALILAALAKGETTLRGALWSEDTQVMVECLQKLGFSVKINQDPDEFCNCILTVKGLGGEIPNAGTAEKPLELFVGNAGTAARFLSALVCLGKGVYRLSGVPRMHERPQAALFDALRELGYQINSENNKLPVDVYGVGKMPGKCTVSVKESSQFASALLLAGKVGCWQIQVTGENAEELPYVALTEMMLTQFAHQPATYWIESDASSSSYFKAIGWLFPPKNVASGNIIDFPSVDLATPTLSMQVDYKFSNFCKKNKIIRHVQDTSGQQVVISRNNDLGDSIMTAIVIAPLAEEPVVFADLDRLRLQECERVYALRTELTRCGAKVIEEGDTLTVFPSQLHGAEIETYDDHRMAMCFAILGLKVPGIKIKNPACVKKTFPNFFQKLAAAPPAGLGATILDARTGRKLAGEELFAD